MRDKIIGFAVRRTNAPQSERSYVGLFTLAEAKRLGRRYADSDKAPVTIVRDHGSGQISVDVQTIKPRA